MIRFLEDDCDGGGRLGWLREALLVMPRLQMQSGGRLWMRNGGVLAEDTNWGLGPRSSGPRGDLGSGTWDREARLTENLEGRTEVFEERAAVDYYSQLGIPMGSKLLRSAVGRCGVAIGAVHLHWVIDRQFSQ